MSVTFLASTEKAQAVAEKELTLPTAVKMFSFNYSEFKGCQPEFFKKSFLGRRDFSGYGSHPSHYVKK